MIFIIAEEGTSSFNSVLDAVELAKHLKTGVKINILSRDVYITPNDNPHEIYKKNFPEYSET